MKLIIIGILLLGAVFSIVIFFVKGNSVVQPELRLEILSGIAGDSLCQRVKQTEFFSIYNYQFKSEQELQLTLRKMGVSTISLSENRIVIIEIDLSKFVVDSNSKLRLFSINLLRNDMSIDEIHAIVGLPARTTGSGDLIEEWDMENGSILCISNALKSKRTTSQYSVSLIHVDKRVEILNIKCTD